MIAAKVWRFGDDINTDLMLPGSVMAKSEAEQARAVFAANRPGWINEMKRGDAIVGGRNYGMGSNRPASRSLRNIGVGFLLAESINGLFFRNSVNFGFLALECPGCAAAFEEGDTAELDLDSWSVRNPRTGKALKPLPIPDRLLTLMRGGGIYPVLEASGYIAPRGNNPPI
jgi:3-isopropylmalate/(R)-2-methylmalate dehydratase small subunit